MYGYENSLEVVKSNDTSVANYMLYDRTFDMYIASGTQQQMMSLKAQMVNEWEIDSLAMAI